MTIQSLVVRLEPDQLKDLAKMVAAELRDTRTNSTEPYTIPEAAKALRLGKMTVRRRIAAGLIRTVPNSNNSRIPAAEIERLLNPGPPA